jgi:hypothetical protein
MKSIFLTALLSVACVLGSPFAAVADSEPEAQPAKTFFDRFSRDFRVLAYGTLQEPADSTQNPGNRFLQSPHYLGALELRPDLRVNLAPLELMAKPRIRIEYSSWSGSDMPGRAAEWDEESYLNEWLARLKVREDLFLSYGRENLQWGPSFLFSPSNPFFPDNGRRNPYLEVAGSDFARVVWIPESSWTFSFIANTEDGRNKPIGPDAFERAYAAKMDFTGSENYASLILSHREYAGNTVGFFGGWTLSDAVLLYAEGAVSEGGRALYSEEDRSPWGASMQQIYKNSGAWKPVLLTGGSYSFESLGTLTLEYAYNGQGYGDAQAERYYALRRQAAIAVNSGGPLAGLAQRTLGQTAATGLKFLRRHYLLLQYTQSNIQNIFDLTLRAAWNLDDGSCQYTALVTCFLGDHLELFFVGNVNSGGEDTEFKSILNKQWMLGLKYTF